jgi:hypothetical protein
MCQVPSDCRQAVPLLGWLLPPTTIVLWYSRQ